VEWLNAVNVPRMDIGGIESDPYLKTCIKAKDGFTLTDWIFTQRRRSTTDPVWNSIRDYGIEPKDDDILFAELYDHDSMSPDDLIGTISVPIGEIRNRLDEDITAEVELNEDGEANMVASESNPSVLKQCAITFRRWAAPENTKITFFVIRHGESKWNEAMAEKDVGAMVANDHELNIIGINQAKSLNKSWHGTDPSVFDKETEETLKLFLTSQRVVVSPLTRAIQTALVGLHSNKDDQYQPLKNGITLSRMIREQKNAGGLDTVGKCVGADIAARVECAMAQEFEAEEPNPADKDGTARAREFMVDINVGDATTEWWTKQTDKDSRAQIVERLRDFVSSTFLRQDHGTIFVGHSLYFKALMEVFTGQVIQERNPALYKELNTCKLCNAGCAAVTVDFADWHKSDWVDFTSWEPGTSGGSGGKARITDVKLLFGTTLLNH